MNLTYERGNKNKIVKYHSIIYLQYYTILSPNHAEKKTSTNLAAKASNWNYTKTRPSPREATSRSKNPAASKKLPFITLRPLSTRTRAACMPSAIQQIYPDYKTNATKVYSPYNRITSSNSLFTIYILLSLSSLSLHVEHTHTHARWIPPAAASKSFN